MIGTEKSADLYEIMGTL